MPQDGIPMPAPSGAAFKRAPPVPSQVLAVIMLILMEAMFFTGLVSAFLIVKAGIKPGMWPPPWQPRLPVEITAVNSLALIVSGVLMFVAAHKFKKVGAPAARKFFLLAMVLGAGFVAVQGFEWVRLLKEGLTLTSSNHGAFFYLIVGTHALHAIGGLIALLWAYSLLRRSQLTRAQLGAVQLFWTFVVGLWPILYTLVYL